MSLESIRQKNISRNKDLIRKLQLDDLNNSIAADLRERNSVKSAKRKSPSKIAKTSSPAQPTRRSRRIAQSAYTDDEILKAEEEREKEQLLREKIRESRQARLKGEFSFPDLIADRKRGALLRELHILETSVKEKEAVSDSEDQAIQALLAEFDLTWATSERKRRTSGSNESEVRVNAKNLTQLTLHRSAEIKVIPNRITSNNFHPNVENRIISCGDTNGCLSILALDQESDTGESLKILLKPHGKVIARIIDMPHKADSLMTTSYDGSCRINNLAKQKSFEAFSINDEYGNPLALSDFCFRDSNETLTSALSGELLRFDLREPPHLVKSQSLLRLHDKKIGGCSINPNNPNELATSSLDRTLKVWDLRSISKKNLLSELAVDSRSPLCKGLFTSKLSISNVDWNSNNKLVCNGYDNTISILDASQLPSIDLNEKKKKLHPAGQLKQLPASQTLKHNCQTGRWVSILKARWQRCPLDNSEKFAIANMNRSIDIYDEEGKLLASLADPEGMTSVPAVVAIHPTQNWVVGGSSTGKMFTYL